MKTRWFLAAAVSWPMIHLVAFLLRFRALPPLGELALFVPTALIGAMAVHLFMLRSHSALQTTSLVFGALLFAPLAFFGNLVGGVLGPLGPTLYGAAPLTAGAALGWVFGKRFNRR